MSRRRTTQPERGLSPGRLILATGVLALVFSAGLIAGQRVMLEDSLPPLISVGQPALSSQRLAHSEAQSEGEETPEKEGRREAIFSFYESLTRPEARPLITRKEQPPLQAAPAPRPVKAPTPSVPEPAETSEPAAIAEVAKVEQADTQNAVVEEAPVIEAAVAAPAASADDEVEAARYTLQVASHPTMERARAEMDKLSSEGLSPHVIAADIPGQGKFYRVRIGKFATVEQARAFQAQVQRTREVRTFVTPL